MLYPEESGRATIIHIPHSSTAIPDSVRTRYMLTPAGLDRELLLMTDRWTDELFALEDEGIRRIVYPVSRLVVDPERFRNDADEPRPDICIGTDAFHTPEDLVKLAENDIEVNRALYMDETGGEKLAEFDKVKDKLGRCLKAII